MLHLKQTLHKNYIKISKTILTIKTDLQSRGVVALNSPYQENLGKLLLSLKSLMSTVLLTTVIFILNLLLLIVQTLMRLAEQLMNIGKQVLNVLYTLCLWVVDLKSTISMYKKWRIFAWRKGGDSHQDSTSVYSEMRGEPKINMPIKHYSNKQHENAMKAPIDQDAIRKAGW